MARSSFYKSMSAVFVTIMFAQIEIYTKGISHVLLDY